MFPLISCTIKTYQWFQEPTQAYPLHTFSKLQVKMATYSQCTDCNCLQWHLVMHVFWHVVIIKLSSWDQNNANNVAYTLSQCLTQVYVCMYGCHSFMSPSWYTFLDRKAWYHVANNNIIAYSCKIWRGVKFGGLVARIETAKLKSANTIPPGKRNDMMHVVTLLAQSNAPPHKL